MSERIKVRIGPLDSVGGLITEMAKVYRHARRGELETTEATRLVFMLRSMRQAIEGQNRRISGFLRIDDMSEEELLEFLGGEPDGEELGAIAGSAPIAAAPAPGRPMGLSDLRDRTNGSGGTGA